MLCKEEVCQWFRTLSGPKRIDLMSGLLQMCLPLEIRFLGSCVEDLAGRNYQFLRESEIKANDLNEVGNLGNMLDDFTRSKLNIYLALLHSSNRVCSNALFNTLTCPEPLHQRTLVNLPNSTRMRLAEEILLLYTMAAHHPAFNFNQRQVLFAKLEAVQQLLESQRDESSNSTSSTNCSISNSPSTTITQQHTPNPAKKVYVRNIEVKGSQGTPDRRREFYLQVKWSDGEVTETFKTYQALHTFHAELIKLFPKDSGAHKQDRQIPFFPSEKGPGHTTHGLKELTDLVRKYVKQLVALPDHIIQCSHVTRFLQNKPEKDARSPLTVRGVDDELVTSTGSGHKGSMTFYNSNISDGRRASSDKHNKSPMRPQVPTVSSVTIHSNQRHVYSNTGSSPSPFSSPMQSPMSSPHVSPSASHYSSRSASPWSSNGKFDMLVWLKQARLHKYQEALDGYTLEELLKLNDTDLRNIGVTQGARNKFLAEIEKLRIDGIKNGLVTSGSSVGSRATSPGSPWHSPPHNSVHLSPPVSQSPVASQNAQFNLPTNHQPVHNSPSGSATKESFQARGDCIEYSPECTENFSPPTSPGLLNVKSSHPQCPLMDEVDRENEREPFTSIMEKEEDKEPFQNNIPQGAIVESRPLVTAVYPKQDGNQNNNAFISASGIEVKAPHIMEGVPVPYAQGIPRPMMQMDPPQMPMFFTTHRPNIRSQHPPIKPPMGTPAVIQSPKLPNMNGGAHVVYENGPLLQVTKVSVHDHMPSSTGPIAVSMNALTTVDTMPTYNSKSVLGYPVPTAVVTNGASRPVTLALPISASIGNVTMTYSVAPTIASVEKCAAPPPLQPIIPTSVVDSNAYIAYHTVQSGSSTFTTRFQNQGAHVAATPVQTPGPTPTNNSQNPVPLQGVSSNISTPLQTPGSGVPQLPHTPALVATPPAPPVASQSNPPPAASAPSCSTCGCNGHCTSVASTSNPGYPPVVWHQHPMFPAGYPLGMLPVTSNGIVPPNLPYSHPLQAMNLPNGINPDVVYNSQPPNFSMIQQSDNCSNAVYVTSTNSGVYSTAPPSHIVPTHIDSTNGKGKVMNCFNCGEAGHRAVDCGEQSMESLTHNGYHLNLCAKSDSE